MAIVSAQISLVAADPAGRNLLAADFVGPLCVSEDDEIQESTSNRGRWASSQVVFRPVHYDPASATVDVVEQFEAQLAALLVHVSRFLARRTPEVFHTVRSGGLDVYLHLDLWICDNQLALTLPTALVAECARLSLPIYTITNDFGIAFLEERGAT